MRAEDFDLLYNLEETYWWFVAMRQITDTIASSALEKPNLRILDAGCGTGFNLGYYASVPGRDVYGLDVTMDALEWVRKRGFQKITQASVTEIPFRSETFDLVFSFDVLPQVPLKMDEPAIGEMYRVLKPNGRLFVRAAAFEWLRSSHDEELHTMHRFTQPELVEKLTRAGFEVEWSSYANGFLFPVILLRRFLKHAGIGKGTDVRPLPQGLGWLDSIFKNVLSREAGWFKAGRTLPFGLSVVCLARKRN
jgi:ubiquinone/menaquinone biosynthesis C-methylase UbiE